MIYQKVAMPLVEPLAALFVSFLRVIFWECKIFRERALFRRVF